MNSVAKDRFRLLELTPLKLYRALCTALFLGIALTATGPAHSPHQEYYTRWLIFNIAALLVLYHNRTNIQHVFRLAIEWLRQPQDHVARRVVFGCVVVMVLTYATRAHIGFWFPGILGWTFENKGSRIVSSEPPLTELDTPLDDDLRAALAAATVPENARFLRQRGYLTGTAFLLHFKDGSILPANYELTDFVFPQYIFGGLHARVAHEEEFASVVQSRLRMRQAGRRFILPLDFAYPNHTPYMPIDYTDYPPAQELLRITLWRMVTFVSPVGEVRVVAAKRNANVHVH